MAQKKKFNFLWTLALYLVACRLPKAFGKPRVPSIFDPKFKNEFLDIHNELRSKVQPPASDMNQMTWDKALAKLAKEWTKECKFSHNPCTSKRYECLQDYDFIGENIYLGAIDAKPEDVVTAWYNESKDYNFEFNTCSKTCGHYTQVVWAKTFKIGCAVSNCPHLTGNSAGLFLCNYVPAGNFLGVKPYTKGDPCSMCGDKACENNLCSSKNSRTSKHKLSCHLLVLGFILQRLL
ncbi:GLIPR1-like protein 1 [Mastomys coucha]|uniref:GLIPR1-like protein 1 n=1 Tax=Mastomys coucha TaxID=35658 RepID=UPI0012626C1C|nr:GLIPR1-like protein 1 [Mastomys coucha]